ncbi:hypothetical protein [Streptomyces sp. NPDC094437]|uniref:hypothetical protein n=1 Tax=Streptomyces sp. NPDC094437 TaxID=3366060 RepID=UPI00381D67FD
MKKLPLVRQPDSPSAHGGWWSRSGGLRWPWHRATSAPSLLVEELGPCHLSPVMRATGCQLRRQVLTLPDGWIEHTDMTAGRTMFALPGLTSA